MSYTQVDCHCLEKTEQIYEIRTRLERSCANLHTFYDTCLGHKVVS